MGIRHFGIVVRDLERSLMFYRDLLGLIVVRKMDESGEYIDAMLALCNVKVTTVKMTASSGDTLLELLKFESPSSPAVNDIENPTRIGPTHVAFTVEDLAVIYRRLSEAGVKFNCPPQRAPDGNALVTFCHDPDGTLIELVEVLQ